MPVRRAALGARVHSGAQPTADPPRQIGLLVYNEAGDDLPTSLPEQVDLVIGERVADLGQYPAHERQDAVNVPIARERQIVRVAAVADVETRGSGGDARVGTA